MAVLKRGQLDHGMAIIDCLERKMTGLTTVFVEFETRCPLCFIVFRLVKFRYEFQSYSD